MSTVEESRTEVRDRLRTHLAEPARSHGHRDLGEPARDGSGAPSLPAAADPYELDDRQRLFLFSRTGTVHAGSSEIRRHTVAERVLGLPKEARA